MKFSATVLLLASLTSLTHAVRLHRPYLIKSAENNLFLKESGGDYWKGDLKFGPLGVDGSVDFSFEPAYGNPGFYHIAQNTGFQARYVYCDPPESGTVCYLTPFVDLNLRQKFELVDLDGQTMFSDPDSGLVLSNEKDVLKMTFPTGGNDQRFILTEHYG